MATPNLHNLLAYLVARGMGLDGAEPTGHQGPNGSNFRGGQADQEPAAPPQQSFPPKVLSVTEDLLRQTFEDTSRFPYTTSDIDPQALTGGNTAGLVARIGLSLGFVLKFDETQEKLAKEGDTIRNIKTNPQLPEAFRQAWPDVYAIHRQPHGPYAYLMEWIPSDGGWCSLEDRLYRNQGQPSASTATAGRWLDRILDLLFLGYQASINRRSLPSLREDYLERIRERLKDTQASDPAFAPRPLIVNGQALAPWDAYLAVIEADLDAITPPFSTVAHGDPNPGNLMLRDAESGELDVKLIDPKEWEHGDYLFDIAKITHFLEGTGPIEHPAAPASVILSWPEADEGGPLEISSHVPLPSWTTDLVDRCLARSKRFAEIHGDSHWSERYELAMASNLLGLPLGRLNKGRRDSALLLYLQGLQHLQRYCERRSLQVGKSSLTLPAPQRAAPNDVEPAQLGWLRELVRNSVPEISETLDRRGFQLLHWPPVRSNGNNKPAELSLEYGARMRPANEAKQTRLLNALLDSEDMPAGKQLLPEGHEFCHLLVRRYQRDSGPQSTDRYYDTPCADGATSLLPHAITVRERIHTSQFMTWNAGESEAAPNTRPPRPLNLELPFVALGDSGITVRLEFNWVDDLTTCLEEAIDGGLPEEHRLRNPLVLAQRHLDHFHSGLSLQQLEPVLEHTTYRQKFSLLAPPQGNKGEPQEVFVINVDTVVAQNLRNHRLGTYVDVDISSVSPVDTVELTRLHRLMEGLAGRFRMQPNPASKALRSALATGLLAPGWLA
jgi:hypothetical protein